MPGRCSDPVNVEITIVNVNFHDFGELPAETTVYQIKQRIQSLWNETTVETQSLAVNGVEAENHRTLASFGLPAIKFDLQEASYFNVNATCTSLGMKANFAVSKSTPVAELKDTLRVYFGIRSIESITLLNGNIVLADNNQPLSRYNVGQDSEIEVVVSDEGASSSS